VRLLEGQIAGGIAFVAIGVVVSLCVVLVQDVGASPDPGVSYVWRGTAPSGQYCYPWGTLSGHHPCWHGENDNRYTAIDYSYPGVDGDSAWLDYTGDFQLFKTVVQTDYCTGVRAKIYLGSYAEQNYKGDLHYLHIDPNELWMNQEVPYQLIYIGDVLAQELDPYCPWDDAHLHQSARITAETPFYTNKLANPSQGDNWEHAIFWGNGSADQDSDGFTNATEIYISTDLYDNCPDGWWDDAWPLDINKDRNITVTGDVLSFRGRIGATPGVPNWWKRLDFNTDGLISTVGDVLKYSGKIGTSCS